MARTPADRGAVQRVFVRMYGRLGSRVIWVHLATGLLMVAVTVGFTVVWFMGYGALPAEQLPLLLAIAEPVGLATALAVPAYSWRDIIRPLLSWSGSVRSSRRAVEIWDIAVRAPTILVRRAAIMAVPPAVTMAFVAAPISGVPLYTVAPLLGVIVIAVAAMGFLALFGGELLLRPMVEDIAAHLPPNFEPPARGWRLGTKAVLPLPVVALYTALMVGAFASGSSNGAVRVSVTLGISLATVAVAGVIFLIVTRSTLGPLADLTAATDRVRRGDLSTPVPVVTADDLGDLAARFNHMLAGLREREALRERNLQQAEELRESRARIVATADAERRRMERDLHDGAQQRLVLLGLKLGMAERLVESDPAGAATLHAELRDEVEAALAELRNLAHGIYPPLLENEGLPGALREAAERAAIPTSLCCHGAGRYPRELEAAVYFCCLEALQNAAKHAGEGARATVTLAERDGTLTFTVADDGRGYDQASVNSSAGLQNMQDRIGALGGRLEIEAAPGRGTRVVGTVPLSRPVPA